MATLQDIFIASSAGQPMQRLAEVQAIAGQGLAGDRYAVGNGYYSGRCNCEVTLIEAEVLEAIEAAGGPAVRDGQHRRNLATRGVRLRDLEGGRLRIGDVVLEYDRPRPPCDYVQRLTEPGMTKALGRGAGIGMRVVAGGWLRQGTEIVVEPGVGRRRLP